MGLAYLRVRRDREWLLLGLCLFLLSDRLGGEYFLVFVVQVFLNDLGDLSKALINSAIIGDLAISFHFGGFSPEIGVELL